MWREERVRTSVNPLREIFDAAAKAYSVKLTCRSCRRERILSAAAIWRRFRRKGYSELLREIPAKFRCRVCDRREPVMDLVHEEPNDTSLPLPTDQEWKRELGRLR
jgi:hypothetical protein